MVSHPFLPVYLAQGATRAAFGRNGGDPERSAASELQACQKLIRARIQLSEAALADDQVDLWSLTTTPR
jgi:hypothetical protein